MAVVFTRVAQEIASLAYTFRKHYSLCCAASIMGHYLLTASTIHILDAESAMQDEDCSALTQANEALEICCSTLNGLGMTEDVAYRAMAVTQRFRAHRESPRAWSKALSRVGHDRTDENEADVEASHETEDRACDDYDIKEPILPLTEGLEDVEQMEMLQDGLESISFHTSGGIASLLGFGHAGMDLETLIE